MSRIVLLLLALGLIVQGRFAAAQETAPAADAAKADAAPAKAAVEEAASADEAKTSAEGDAETKPEPSPEAVKARAAFEVIRKQWQEVVAQIPAVQKERQAAKGEKRAELDKQVVDLYRQAEALIDKIGEAGLAVYQADPEAYPEVNDTLVVIAQFELNGGTNGDGGDQYEKALKLISGLIDAGAGAKYPQLYFWGGLAAYNCNEFDLAERYFAESSKANGEVGGLAPNLVQNGLQAQGNLTTMKKAWEKESAIRAAEAKADNNPRVKLTTTKGDVVIELFENEAPQAVANFLTLVKSGFYDGLTFHRVIPGFMAQGGDPDGNGSGGPGYSIKCECYKPDYRHHFRGSLSMAHAGRDTGGSQFFLTFVPTSFLDGRHTVFGRVVDGMDNASSIKRGEPVRSPDKIVKAEVLRDRGHEYKFDKLPGK
ncbi:peptidylprolyl isomerase [Lacipirellula parvula]|uniref:peptidylprolyl isomerase n=1 Tax=Lacipirellula parvula TaxID=2650471 RepID=A0A5K7X1J7_9BACT|nr:peptidylprolyl isomerase [Lacipirellula parvula]BBO30518.1 peptidyl-prolyl cis-trans isomerase [Lacipirellula parvula]